MRYTTILLIALIIIVTTISSFAQITGSKNHITKIGINDRQVIGGLKERYYQATYIGLDSVTRAIMWGTYFYTVTNGGFINRNEVLNLLYRDYKLRCRERDMALTITEFKNKTEWLKLNRK